MPKLQIRWIMVLVSTLHLLAIMVFFFSFQSVNSVSRPPMYATFVLANNPMQMTIETDRSDHTHTNNDILDKNMMNKNAVDNSIVDKHSDKQQSKLAKSSGSSSKKPNNLEQMADVQKTVATNKVAKSNTIKNVEPIITTHTLSPQSLEQSITNTALIIDKSSKTIKVLPNAEVLVNEKVDIKKVSGISVDSKALATNTTQSASATTQVSITELSATMTENLASTEATAQAKNEQARHSANNDRSHQALQDQSAMATNLGVDKHNQVQRSYQGQDDWQAQVRLVIEHGLVYPKQAMAKKWGGKTVVRIQIDASGHVLAATVVKSSGKSLLDNEAIQCIQRVSPLPKPPDGNSKTFSIPINFDYKRYQ